MSCDLWAYVPEICDGDLCVLDCGRCPKRDQAMQAQEEEDDAD